MSASILTHPKFDRPPVQQQGRNGRHPKAIVMLWKHAGAKRFAAHERQERLDAIEKLKSGLAFYQDIISHYHSELAQLKQGGGT